MNVHIFKMTKNVEETLALFLGHWRGELGRNPCAVADGDIVILLGHGGGDSTVQFVHSWLGLSPALPLANTQFVLMMCGQGHDGGSAQVAELIVQSGARSVIYSDTMIIAAHVLEMPEGLGIARWEDLSDKDDGEIWERPDGARGSWTCLSNVGGRSLSLVS